LKNIIDSVFSIIKWYDIAIVALDIPALFYIADKKKFGFILMSFANLIALYLGVIHHLWGWLFMNLIYLAINIYSWNKWRKEERMAEGNNVQVPKKRVPYKAIVTSVTDVLAITVNQIARIAKLTWLCAIPLIGVSIITDEILGTKIGAWDAILGVAKDMVSAVSPLIKSIGGSFDAPVWLIIIIGIIIGIVVRPRIKV